MELLPKIALYEAKIYMSSLNEKDNFLTRKEIIDIYGKEVFANCIKQAQSIKLQQQNPHIKTYVDQKAEELAVQIPNYKQKWEKILNKKINDFVKMKGDRISSVKNDLLRLLRSNIDTILLSCNLENKSFGKEIENKIEVATDLYLDIVGNTYTKKINESGKIQLFQEIIKATIYSNYTGELVAGFGGSEDNLNVRLPSYILPQLIVLRSFIKRGVTPPSLRILNAQSVAANFNNMDKVKTYNNAVKIKSLLSGFIDKFFPECKPYIHFTIPDLEEFVESNTYSLVLNALKNFASENPDNKQIKSLLNKAKKHNQTTADLTYEELTDVQKSELMNRSLNYLSCHIVETCFGDLRNTDDIKNKPFYMIKFGGDGENDFNFFEELIANHHWFRPINTNSETYRTNTSNNNDKQDYVPIQFNLNIANLPPYYNFTVKNENGDWENKEILLEQLNANTDLINHYQKNAKNLVKDIEAYQKAEIDIKEYIKFLLERIS